MKKDEIMRGFFFEYFRTNWVSTTVVATVSYIQWFAGKGDHIAHISAFHNMWLLVSTIIKLISLQNVEDVVFQNRRLMHSGV